MMASDIHSRSLNISKLTIAEEDEVYSEASIDAFDSPQPLRRASARLSKPPTPTPDRGRGQGSRGRGSRRRGRPRKNLPESLFEDDSPHIEDSVRCPCQDVW